MSASPSITPHSARILDLLRHSSQALSAYDILDKMRSCGMRSPPTVYRALDQLVAKGLVHRIETLNAFTHCRHGDAHAHVSRFAVCLNCKTVQEIKHQDKHYERPGTRFLKKVEREIQEIAGLCRDCYRQAG